MTRQLIFDLLIMIGAMNVATAWLFIPPRSHYAPGNKPIVYPRLRI